MNEWPDIFPGKCIAVIIVALPFEIFTSGQLHHAIMVPGGTTVLVASVITNTQISCAAYSSQIPSVASDEALSLIISSRS